MWEGPGQGPRGGPPFRGDHRGEMFGGRDGPMPDFRGRDGMNMGPIGPRPLDQPPMDMRRMDGPPMRGRDMEPHNMRGREPNRDFFRPGEETDFTLRRQYEISIRDKLMNASGFMGPGRNPLNMGGRGIPPQEQNNRFMDMRDREAFLYDMPGFNNPNMDARRFPLDPMERHDGFRDVRGRLPMDRGDIDGYNMDAPPHEKRMMDIDRGGDAPFNARGGFESDMDFRRRPGPPAEFSGRDRSPLRFGDEVAPMDRGRSDMPPNVCGPQRPGFTGAKDSHGSRSSPLTDYRSGEEMTLAEEWKTRQDSKPVSNMSKGMGRVTDKSVPVGFGREGNVGDPASFKGENRPSAEFPGKEGGFPHVGHFPDIDPPSIDRKAPQDHPHPNISPLAGSLGRDSESKHWLGVRDLKQSQKASNLDERSTCHQEKNRSFQEMKETNQGPSRSKIGTERDFQSSSAVQGRDQDYRDIDYRTGPGRAFDYKREAFPAPEKVLKVAKPISPLKFSDAGSQDQDYRSASVEDKVSSTISIIGIPKTATMEQILGAFAVRDGVPMQGMKIKSVVPGYSYDTAYVEFLNLEDAVHFMESNKRSLKVGTKIASMKYIQPDKIERSAHESDPKVPQPQKPMLPIPDEPLEKLKNSLNGSKAKVPMEPMSQGQRQRSSDLTPEAWQQQVDQQLRQQETEQQATKETWANSNHPHPHNSSHQTDPAFKDSKTMIIKNLKPLTTVETILKSLDPFAYLDERNVRLVKGKTPGANCFCFVDMDSHEQVKRLVDILTKPRPISIDGVRVYAAIAKPLKNQTFRKDLDKPSNSLLGHPPEANMMGQQYPQSLQYSQPLQPSVDIPADMKGDLNAGSINPSLSSDSSFSQGIGCVETPIVDPLYQAVVSAESAGMTATADGSATYVYGSEIPDLTSYLFDATSGFYYDPETTLYYDPSSRYFYNAQTQVYLYWDAMTKTYIPVPGGNSTESQPVTMTAEVQAILSNPAADAPLEMKKPSELTADHTVVPTPDPLQTPAPALASDPNSTPESVLNSTSTPDKREEEDSAKKDKDKDGKEDKPKSLAAIKIMKDMERWAKIQNRQKETVRSPSPVLKIGGVDDRKTSKAADAGFAIFERKGDDLFKKPLTPTKKEDKGKRPMGSLGLLASDYAAGSDEEVEEEKQETPKSFKSQSDDKDDKLTDWKKMACLLCRRQFPNKDALLRHQQLSDLHKQNMEIHLKIKRSKKELEALENQEKELSARETPRSPEQKRRKHHHQPPAPPPQQQQFNTWAGSSRDMHKVSERPGLGSEPMVRKKKEPVVWDHATYKQAVRKAMFARFKELD